MIGCRGEVVKAAGPAIRSRETERASLTMAGHVVPADDQQMRLVLGSIRDSSHGEIDSFFGVQ